MDGWLLDIASAVTSGCILTVNLTACTRHSNKCQHNSTRGVAHVFKPPRGVGRSVHVGTGLPGNACVSQRLNRTGQFRDEDNCGNKMIGR
jgi:hypothetical protein